MDINKIIKVKITSNLKQIAIIGAINFVLSAMLCTIFYFVAKENILGDYGKAAYDLSATVASILDVDKIIEYKKSLKIDDEYKDIVRQLDLIKYRTGLKYLYVNSWNGVGDRFAIYDATNPGDGIEDSVYDRELLGTHIESNKHFDQVVSDSENLKQWHEDNNKYGHTVCAYYPIVDSNGDNVAAIGADFEVDKIFDLRKKVLNFLLIVQILIVGSTIATISFIDRYVSSPLRKMSKIASHFVNSDHNKINIVPINFNIKLSEDSNIRMLANSMHKMMVDVKEYAKNIKIITAEKERISAELNIATKIQKSLIPHIFPAFPELKEIDIYATMNPARKVGGDFYDFFLLDNNKLAFVIADVSGKGIAAALFMVIAKTLIKNEASSSSDPKTIMENVNKQMCIDNSSGMFITSFFGILDFKTGEVQYVNAGHMNPILKKTGVGFQELNLEKQFVIAGMPSLKFTLNKFVLSPGDTLFMYTDGISEAKNSDNLYFGKEKLISLLNSSGSDATLKQISELVQGKIKEFTKGSSQIDDITMLIVKYNGMIVS